MIEQPLDIKTKVTTTTLITFTGGLNVNELRRVLTNLGSHHSGRATVRSLGNSLEITTEYEENERVR